MSGSLLPWWGWLLVLQALFVYGLFEYVRRSVSDPTAPSYDDSDIKARFAIVAREQKAIIDDYQRMSGLEARTTESLAAIDQALNKKVEDVRAEVATSARDIEKFGEILNREIVTRKFSLFSLGVREALDELASQIRDVSNDLFDHLSAGEVYDAVSWTSWESCHSHWKSLLEQWLNTAQWYASPRQISSVKVVTDEQYGQSWNVSDSQFPSAEAVRRFRKCRVIHQQWENLVPRVKRGIEAAAFQGMSEEDVRRDFD